MTGVPADWEQSRRSFLMWYAGERIWAMAEKDRGRYEARIRRSGG